ARGTMRDRPPLPPPEDALQRRELLALLGLSALGMSWPGALRAQSSDRPARGKVPTIGLMGSGTAATQRPWTDAFLRRMNELGWDEGRTIAIEYRWGEGRV